MIRIMYVSKCPRNIKKGNYYEKTKSILSILLAIIFVSLSVTPSFAAAEKSPETPYEYLLSCGYSEKFLNSASEKLLLNIYSAIGDNEVGDVYEKTIYLNESGVPYISNPLGNIEDDSLKITLEVSAVYRKGTKEVGSVLYSVLWEWAKNKPQIRHEDPVSINWDADVFCQGAFYAQDTARNTLTEELSCLKDYDTPAQATQGGLGHFNEIAWTYNYNYIGGGIVLILEPSNRMFKYGDSRDIKKTDINFNFVHNRNPLGLGVSITPEGLGVTINPGTMSDSKSSKYTFSYSR